MAEKLRKVNLKSYRNGVMARPYPSKYGNAAICSASSLINGSALKTIS
jgi:hypothetical protein